MTTVKLEKRREQRIHTELLVFLENATGVMRDVSASGMFFWTDVRCASGELISFAVEISRPAGKATLKCQGNIVRTELRDAMVGVAVRIVESGMELA